MTPTPRAKVVLEVGQMWRKSMDYIRIIMGIKEGRVWFIRAGRQHKDTVENFLRWASTAELVGGEGGTD